MITAEVLADSVNGATGSRVTTFILRYPRFLHPEVLTHRVFSRNSASSRAIPVSKMMAQIWANPMVPLRFGRSQRGMQDGGALPPAVAWVARLLWLTARYPVLLFVWLLLKLKVHKQVANRLLEPWAQMTVVLTSTEWRNFYRLRLHKDAQPEMQELARVMLRAHAASVPRILQPGQWHLPFGDRHTEGIDSADTLLLLAICTARCARVSYANFYGKYDFADDLRLHEDLRSSGHWSPFEHCCRAGDDGRFCGNLRGYIPYRKLFVPSETHDTSEPFDPVALCKELM